MFGMQGLLKSFVVAMKSEKRIVKFPLLLSRLGCAILDVFWHESVQYVIILFQFVREQMLIYYEK